MSRAIERLAQCGEALRESHACVTAFAARERDLNGRRLLAITLKHHIAALQRVADQLSATVDPRLSPLL